MIHPDTSANELRSLARGAMAQQDPHTAILLLRRILELEPRSAADWYDLAMACMKTDDVSGGVEAMRKAVALQPKNAAAQQQYANMLSATGAFAQALATHRRAITLGLNNPEASWVEVGRIHVRMRQPKLARQAVEKALAIKPGLWAGHDLLGDLALQEGDLDEAQRQYETALAGAPDPLQKATVAHAIGSLHEKRKEWDEAFAAHDRANRVKATSDVARFLLRQGLPPHYSEFHGEGAGEYYGRWGAQTYDDGLPAPIALVGFPRSGTTMVEQVLAALPNVRTTDEHTFMTPVSERARSIVRQFPETPTTVLEGIDKLSPGNLSELRQLYWSEVWKVVGTDVRDEGGSVKVVDKHPLRILDVGMLNRLFPRTKVIVMIRDPRDCCLSAFFQDLGLTPVSARFLRLETLGDVYATIMGFWTSIREHLSIEWIEVRYEDFVSDFEANARRLVEFVGEPWDDRVLEFHKKAAKRTINTPSYEAVTQKVNTRAVGKWANYESHLGPLVERVRPFLEAFGYEE